MKSIAEVGERLEAIVVAVNALTIEDLDELIRKIDREQAIGPLIDPTLWATELMAASTDSVKVLRAIRAFKAEVAILGYFAGG